MPGAGAGGGAPPGYRGAGKAGRTGRGGSVSDKGGAVMPEEAPGNPGVLPGGPGASPGPAGRVRGMQAKLHPWAGEDPSRRFGDLFNLVCDPYFLAEAWMRVSGNRGARTPGIDGVSVAQVERRDGGVSGFLAEIRGLLRSGEYRASEVRQEMIPKRNGKLRKLGIPTLADRVVQASLKLVLEPIFEADFQPCSYGFRPGRRAQDAIAEIHHLSTGSRKFHWVLEADIRACFDEIDHTALMDRFRGRIKDKRTCALVKSFLKAGIMTQTGDREDSLTGTPQGGLVTPPTQKATSASRPRWVTGGWSVAGEPRGAGGAAGAGSGRFPARGGAARGPGGRAGRRRTGGVGPAGREVADGAGHVDAADGCLVDRAVAGCGAVPVSGLAGHGACLRLLLDVICSSFMSCLGIAVRVPPSTRRMSTLPRACWKPGSRRRRRPGCWPGGWAARSGRPGVTSPGRGNRAGSRSRTRERCSPSGFRCGWPPRSGSTPGHPAARSPRSPPRRWRNSCPVPTGTVRAGEAAAGGDGARLLPPCRRGNVSGLRHLGAAAA